MDNLPANPSLNMVQLLLALAKHLARLWFLLVLAAIIGAGIGYFFIKKVKTTYSATINFVLSSEQKPSSLSGLASQMGFDLGNGADNIFSGDNIIDFFKSRGLIGKTLLSVTDTSSKETLVNLIIRKHYPDVYNKLGPLGPDPDKYNLAQTTAYRDVITFVSDKFAVLKKDKRLIFYLIIANDTDPDVAYYIAKNMLNQTAVYFIETKTKVSRESLRLIKKEADSLSQIISQTYSSTAAAADRTYNLNPSLTIQRSGIQNMQAKAFALTQAYQQVMQNLEAAKMSVLRETPLYRVIDMPELPLLGVKPSVTAHVIFTACLGILLMSLLLIADYFLKNKFNYNASS